MVEDERETLRLSEMVATRLGGLRCGGRCPGYFVGTRRDPSELHVDLGIYHRPESPPRIENLRLLARESWTTATAGGSVSLARGTSMVAAG